MNVLALVTVYAIVAGVVGILFYRHKACEIRPPWLAKLATVAVAALWPLIAVILLGIGVAMVAPFQV